MTSPQPEFFPETEQAATEIRNGCRYEKHIPAPLDDAAAATGLASRLIVTCLPDRGTPAYVQGLVAAGS